MMERFNVDVVGAASIGHDSDYVKSTNTLFVLLFPGESEERIYWQGQRLNGTVDHSQPKRKSRSQPYFTMVIDGQPVPFGTEVLNPDWTFEFMGETLYHYGSGTQVAYDSRTDCPAVCAM